MGDHVNTKKDVNKRHKRGFSEGLDIQSQRKRRVTFKTYMKELEENLMDSDLDDSEFTDDSK